MISHKSDSVLIAFATILFGLFSAKAGGDKVAFPENYAKGVKWLIVDKPQLKRINEYYATPDALEAARKNQPMPEGTVFVGAQYQIQLDGQGNPVLGSDGHFIKANLSRYIVMEKHVGWGAEYPPELRNGEWEYQIFKADKTLSNEVKLTACLGCHKPFASQDYVQKYDKLKGADTKQ